jgi:hypothetical protein
MLHRTRTHARTIVIHHALHNDELMQVFSGHNLAESFTSNAYEANYIEFGGVHCAALYSVVNALANVPGFAIAALGAISRERTGGSLLPLFTGIAMFQGLGALAYARFATVTTLR